MTQVVSSISGLEIYSPSAGYAPTNSGDVSAIASAYVESGVSSKLDTSAQVVTSTASGNYLGNDCIDHINGHYIHASDAGVAYMDENFRQLSALPDSAAVSAIASAYQVVSATATQLYAGTAFLTGVNGAPVSASRAGQAANASMATSAYYDGTGRLISALPDSAAVSSIASSYAESAVSGKADSSSLSSYALSSDVSGCISAVSANSASWGGASLPITGTSGDDSASYDASSIMFTRYDTAGEPDIRTAILTPDSLWMDYTLDGNDHTSMTLNESMLNFTLPDGDRYVDAYTIDSWNSAVDTVANNSATWGQDGVDSATVSAIASSYAESAVSSKLDSSASSSFYTTANESGFVDSAYVGSAVDSAVSSYQPLSGMSAYESSFSAGEGLEFVTSGDDRILQVEAPVDIVAGPGIVIDNPDGNTLRVSVAQAEETVLWDGEGTGATTVTLSETLLNFETIKIFYAGAERYGEQLVLTIEPNSNIASQGINITDWFINSAGSFLVCSMGFYTVSNDGKTLTGSQIKHMWFTVPNMTYSGAGSSGVKLFKIVGCNRIANN